MLSSNPETPKGDVTRHAAQRIEQRGIRRDALRVVLLHGDDVPAGNGCVRRELRSSRLDEILADGIPHEIAEMALRIEAVVAPGEQLVTCYRRAPRGAGWVRNRRRPRRGRADRRR